MMHLHFMTHAVAKMRLTRGKIMAKNSPHEIDGADLVPGVRYVVTRGSDDETFRVGDRIFVDTDGDIVCKESGGWICEADAKAATRGLRAVINEEWAARQRADLERQLADLRRAGWRG